MRWEEADRFYKRARRYLAPALVLLMLQNAETAEKRRSALCHLIFATLGFFTFIKAFSGLWLQMRLLSSFARLAASPAVGKSSAAASCISTKPLRSGTRC